ncbi:hypothetical protein acdb102_42400 [Acidothermaceae bacterium B102]|nr:hypothetical protein acdb102_42400 [Acidothermaceae bacterium B102]
MSQPTSFRVVQLGKYPATRSLGQDGRSRLDDLLGEREDVDLTIDFSGVKVMNISFADEFLGKFLTSHDFSSHGTTVKVTGLSPDNRYSVVVCVERRQCQVVVLDEGKLVLVGDKMLADTFATALQLRSFRANDLGEAMRLTSQNANNRLRRLTEVGALRKGQVTGSTRGGREYTYEVVPDDVADSEQLAPAS